MPSGSSSEVGSRSGNTFNFRSVFTPGVNGSCVSEKNVAKSTHPIFPTYVCRWMPFQNQALRAVRLVSHGSGVFSVEGPVMHIRNQKSPRRGVIVVLSVVLLVLVFGFVAVTVDLGHMAVVKTQLQAAADAAALGSAQEIPLGETTVVQSAKDLAQRNKVAGSPVTLQNSDVRLGFYNRLTHSFVETSTAANAVRVTAKAPNNKFFFAPVFGQNQFDSQAVSIGMLNPRDVVFVVDLSGSMNDDTEPYWATQALTDKFAPLGYPTVATDLMQDIYNDFSFGTYPGVLEPLGEPLGVANDDYAYAEMTKDNGPLASPLMAAAYRILETDDEPVRKQKAYSWIIDNQIARVMPNALPTPDSAVNYDYWATYLDYIIRYAVVGNPPPPEPPSGGGGGGGSSGGGGGPTPPPATGWLDRSPVSSGLARLLATGSLHNSFIRTSARWGLTSLPAPVPAAIVLPGCPRRGAYEYLWLPSPGDSDVIYSFNNPNTISFPAAWFPWDERNLIGYKSYVQFMMDWGRDRSPELDNSVNADPSAPGKTPLSLLSPWCPLHWESTAGGTFQFPPRCQPMHSVRRALIAGINLIKQRNALVSPGSGDRVAIVTFDGLDAYHEARIAIPLTDNYNNAMAACTQLEASSDIGATTSTESGLALARNHLTEKTTVNNPGNNPLGPQGRSFTTKVIVLLTDGMPNQWIMPAGAISSHIASNPGSDYYATGYDWFNSVLVQTDQFRNDQRGRLFSVGMGLGTDYDFMDRIARVAGTDINGLSSRGSGNPAEYEQQLISVLESIINRPGSKLVQ